MRSASLKAALDLQDAGDAELTDLAKKGNAAAFGAIMQRYNRRLYRMARGIIRDDSEAEDVVQDAYVRAFTGLSGFRSDASLSTWLTRITLNEALGRLRGRRPVVGLEVLDSLDNQGEAQVLLFPTVRADADPEAAVARSEVRQVLERAIDGLPEAFRVVFVLRDVEEMSIEETADYLGIRSETVKTRLHRARRLLREALNQTLSSALTDAFPFEGARCARIAEVVLTRLGIPGP